MLSNSHVNNSLHCSPMASLWSCKWLPWNTIAVNLSQCFLATMVTMISFTAKLPPNTVMPQATIKNHDEKRRLSHGSIHSCECFGFCIHPSIHLPCSSFSFFTISGTEIIVTRAWWSQRPYQWRNRPCDSVVFSLPSPGVSSMRIEEKGLWNSQSLDLSSRSASRTV